MTRDDVEVILIGWGGKNHKHDNLQEAALRILDREICNNIVIKKQLRRFLKDETQNATRNSDFVKQIIAIANTEFLNYTTICARDLASASPIKYKAAGPSDSGGPLLRRSGDKFVQIGVVSWACPCDESDEDLFSVYTRVGKFRDYLAAAAETERSLR